MSYALHTLGGFSGLGIVSLTSLVLVNFGRETLPPALPAQVMAEMDSSIAEVISKNSYKGCSAFFHHSQSTSLYVCLKDDTNEVIKPLLFHYSRKRNDRFKQVSHLIKESKFPSTITMHFLDHTSEILKYPPIWLRGLSSFPLHPENDCEVKSEGAYTFNLSCKKNANLNQRIHL
ncbi:hypothetical protein OVS_01970 [Mycoplasma ovis str. Michigan]|uniref:Uncharacterized protein n=1 Tax=Mycoplasma ovis str. Michigan TaxID=1415773 RepID=A0ABM5P1M4_9MOLU|nr:hypothetical protein [Mycoplasma ovis]AHC40264.1 hypothetical protein OVS_01970 [Mycoplasma ovis str. Michigan]